MTLEQGSRSMQEAFPEQRSSRILLSSAMTPRGRTMSTRHLGTRCMDALSACCWFCAPVVCPRCLLLLLVVNAAVPPRVPRQNPASHARMAEGLPGIRLAHCEGDAREEVGRVLWHNMQTVQCDFLLCLCSVCCISRQKIEGAVRYCTAKKLCKKCLYTAEQKYLVLLTDTIEKLDFDLEHGTAWTTHLAYLYTPCCSTRQGQEKLRELEEIMEEQGTCKHEQQHVYLHQQLNATMIHNGNANQGLWDEKFQLGMVDVFDVSDDETDKKTEEVEAKKKKGGGAALPDVEGDETVDVFLNRYKKALLNRRTLLKDVKQRLKDEACTSHEFFDCKLSFRLPVVVFFALSFIYENMYMYILHESCFCKPEGRHEHL